MKEVSRRKDWSYRDTLTWKATKRKAGCGRMHKYECNKRKRGCAWRHLRASEQEKDRLYKDVLTRKNEQRKKTGLWKDASTRKPTKTR